MSEYDMEEIAYQKVKERKKLYKSIGSLVFLTPFFLLIDYMDFSLDWWYWPIFGIAISVIMQAKKVYGFEGARADEWEANEMEREMEKMRRQKGLSSERKSGLDMDEHLNVKETRPSYDARDLV